MAEPGGLVRDRDGEHARVGFAELFYDLVFVFAITQLSHALLAHPTPIGAIEVALLLCATWWSWVYTAWATNFLDPERLRVRLLLFALMAAGLVLSMSIPQAFTERGAVFGVAFAAMQVGRGVFVALALRRAEPEHHRHFVRITLWAMVSGGFWIWGGFADEAQRLAIWGMALAIEFAGPITRFHVPGLGSSDVVDREVEGGHLAERCGLFIIIALGESILITGSTFAEERWEIAAIAAFLSAFVGSLAMWWIYFNIGAERGTRAIVGEADTGRLARLAYTYIHLLIVAGIIVTAASDEIVLDNPQAGFNPVAATALVGGPALYLLGNGVFKRATAGWFPLSHLVGMGGSAALAGVSPWLDALQLSLGSTAILVTVAVWETLSLGADVADTPAKKELAES